MKKSIKKLLHFLSQIIVSPLTLSYILFSRKQENDALFCTYGQILAIIPGKIGSFLRVAFYSSVLSEFSKESHIDFGSYLSHPAVSIGDHVYIGAYCIIGKCTIGEKTSIGSFVNILSGNKQHSFSDINRSIQEQGGIFTTVNIGRDCWIGNNSIIMKNIGERTVIGAGAVVTQVIPSFSIAAGNPCRIIKSANSL